MDFNFDFDRQVAGDHMLVDALRHELNEGREVTRINEHILAARQLRTSAKQALSIDNVIDALEDPRVELVGKLAIVRAILLAESESNYFKGDVQLMQPINTRKFDGTWYASLTKLLTEGVRKSQILRLFENIEIINFNYDRCLELACCRFCGRFVKLARLSFQTQWG